MLRRTARRESDPRRPLRHEHRMCGHPTRRTVHEGVGLARWLTDSEFDDYVSKLKRLMVSLKDVAANIHKELGMQRVLQIYCENKDRPGNEFGTTLHPCQSK